MKISVLALLLFTATLFASDRVLITRLHTNELIIDIYATKTTQRYDVLDRRGNPLVANATIDELRTKSPGAYELVKTSVAIDASNEKSATKFHVLDSSAE